MYLKKVILNNFRCFKHLEVDLHQRLTVFVSENGGGKTAILDGIATGLSPVLRLFSTANQRLAGPGILDADFRLVPAGCRDGVERWVASDYAQVMIETDVARWDNWRPSSPNKCPEERVGQTELSNYTTKIIDNLHSETRQQLPVFAYYGDRRGGIVVPQRLRRSKINYVYPTSALVGCLDSLADLKEMLKWFDDAETTELRANREYRAEDFMEYPVLSAVRLAIESLLAPSFRSPHFDRHHKFVVESSDGTPYQVNQLSQGYRSMLALGMDFARRLVTANGHLVNESLVGGADVPQFDRDHMSFDEMCQMPISGPLCAPAIMLIDEIDLHLHPSWQQRILGDLMRTFPRTQFIVTSHSPQVLSTVPMECIRIIRDEHLYGASFGTDGAEAQHILEDIFLVNARPDTVSSRKLSEYLSLVDQGQWGTRDALQLRKELDEWSHGSEPRLIAADFKIANMRWEAGR